MDGQKGKQYLKDYISRVKPVLSTFIDNEISTANREKFGQISTDLLKNLSQMVSLGKGIRGALVELAYKAFGGTDSEKILNASSFIELFHSAILIHDDFMDRDPLRRGIPSTHKAFENVGKELGVRIPAEHYGNAVAVSLGDSGFYYSWKVLLNSGFSPELLLKSGQLYADCVGHLGLGQALDVSITGRDDIKEEEALKVLFLKSVEYTSVVPMKIGAILSNNYDSEKVEAMENYAECFGWAFQIQDDILGLYAKEEELGKPIGSDLREGKNTLLMIHLRKKGTPEQLEFQKKVLGNESITTEDVEKMKQILKDSGTLQAVLDLGWNYVNEGIKYIPEITSDKEYAETLESLIYFMMERTK